MRLNTKISSLLTPSSSTIPESDGVSKKTNREVLREVSSNKVPIKESDSKKEPSSKLTHLLSKFISLHSQSASFGDIFIGDEVLLETSNSGNYKKLAEELLSFIMHSSHGIDYEMYVPAYTDLFRKGGKIR